MISMPPSDKREPGRSRRTDFGTISEKSSILILPAGVSPIWTSKKTMGRVTPEGASMLKGRREKVDEEKGGRRGERGCCS